MALNISFAANTSLLAADDVSPRPVNDGILVGEFVGVSIVKAILSARTTSTPIAAL